jgi:class 3 adenylate cyclase
VRVFADAMHRVADAETRLFHFYVRGALEARGLPESALAEAAWNAGAEVSRLDEPALRYFHRKALRHAIADTAVLELAEQAGLAGLPETAGQLEIAIAFVDLAGFTRLAEAKGDVEAARTLERFSAVVRQVVAGFDGHVVKQIGDAFLLVFREPRDAVACALDIEARVTATPAFPAVRAGIHHGPVLYREGDYVGATVNLAARVVAQADRHQVLVTDAVRNAVRPAADVELVRLPRRTVKGLSEEIVLYAVGRPAAGVRSVRVTDPVCGMELAAGEEAARLALEGREYRFCSDSCLRRFVAAPERYVRESSGSSSTS